MAYEVKLPSSAPLKYRANRILPRGNNETLTGQVQGQRASDIEERFAIALMKKKLRFFFQYMIYTVVTVPGNENMVDFLVEYNGIWKAFEIDGEIGHKTASQKGDDVVRDALVNEALMKIGVGPLTRIPWTKLEDQEAANRTLEEVLRV